MLRNERDSQLTDLKKQKDWHHGKIHNLVKKLSIHNKMW